MLAASVGIAAWTGLLALRRSAPPEHTLPPIAPLVVPPRPSRLPAGPEFERNAMPAAARRDATPTELVVHIPALHAALRDLDAGIATYDAQTGADFVWVPLTAASAEADGSLTIRSVTHVRGELEVSLATAPQWARHSYLARTRVPLGAAANPGQVTVDLPVVVGTVRLRLPEGVARAGPLRLSRCDDPQWLPALTASSGIEVLRSRQNLMLLGAGCYELADPIDADRRQRFDVPSNGPIDLSSTLTTVRADRP